MKLTSRRLALHASASTNNDQPQPIALPVINDAASIQRAIHAVLQAVADATLEAPRARVLLYGLQIAATNARRIAAEASTGSPAAKEPSSIAEDEPVQVAVAQPAPHAEAIEAVDVDVVEDANETDPSQTTRITADDEPSFSIPQSNNTPLSQPTETPKAATSVTGYTGNARSRLLAFRNKSAAS